MNDPQLFTRGAAPIDFSARAEARAKYQGYIPTGLDYLDDRLLGLMKTDLILIGAETGAGKTTLAQIIAKIAAEHDHKPTFFALEAYRGEVADRYLYRELARLAWDPGHRHPDCGRLTFRRWLAGECRGLERDLCEQAEANIQDWAKNIRVFYRDQKFTAEDITRELMAEKSNADFFVFDHVHYVDSDDPNENRGLKEITQSLRNVTLMTERPVVAIAHLRKRPGFEKAKRIVPTKDDFHGSSDLIKIATHAVILAPAHSYNKRTETDDEGVTVEKKDPDLPVTYVRLDKDRFDGTSDRYIAAMTFDRRTSTYEPGYTLYELNKAADDVSIVHRDDLPRWAQRAHNLLADEDRPFTDPERAEEDYQGIDEELPF